MKSTCPPLQVILVGLELNQQGHAASQEQASSSWPVIFQGVLSFGSFAARREPTRQRPATSALVENNVIFIARILRSPALQTSRFRVLPTVAACGFWVR